KLDVDRLLIVAGKRYLRQPIVPIGGGARLVMALRERNRLPSHTLGGRRIPIREQQLGEAEEELGFAGLHLCLLEKAQRAFEVRLRPRHVARPQEQDGEGVYRSSQREQVV